MFRGGYHQACNYSFREEDTEANKENMNIHANIGNGQMGVMEKLSTIQKILLQQYQIQIQNKRLLEKQGEAISKLQKEVGRISKRLNNGNNKNEGSASSRFKSQSSKTCRHKKSMEKSVVLNNLQERTKAINIELSKRIGDQLEGGCKEQRKPLRFFFPD